METLLGYGSILLLSTSVFTLVYVLARQRPTEREQLGLRGLKRHRAMENSEFFRAIEPVMRFFAAWVAYFPLANFRSYVDKRLKEAGDYLGLTADEFVAMSFVTTGFFSLLGWAVISVAHVSPLFLILLAAAGASTPWSRLSGEIERRKKQMNRGLPAAIDLAAMCMSAGLDFPATLRQIATRLGPQDDVLKEEFERILQELDLGHTRRYALEALAERVPTDSVRDFVAAVTQAEEKGTPLSEVLQIQAKVLRVRRSVFAEESAARASVFMMFPMLLLVIAILLLLMGPFFVRDMFGAG